MFKNEFTLTGKLKFPETRTTSNGNLIFSAILGKGNKEKGYENYKIKAFKEVAKELMYIGDGQLITVTGWISQDNYEKDGKKISNVIFNVNQWEEYTSE